MRASYCTAQDLDHHHYPFAFVVVDGEKNASCRWFLSRLKTLIPNDPQLVFYIIETKAS